MIRHARCNFPAQVLLAPRYNIDIRYTLYKNGLQRTIRVIKKIKNISIEGIESRILLREIINVKRELWYIHI